jgi:hypothetical protein
MARFREKTAKPDRLITAAKISRQQGEERDDTCNVKETS